jgi:hypothetical protein
LIPDHVRSTVTSTEAEAWLVDGFGAAHAVSEKTSIGRNHEGQIVVLAASVSREHAALTRTNGEWSIRDTGSRNGTFVDGTPAKGRVALPPRAILKIGDVAMWFLQSVAEEPVAPPSMETGSVGGGLIRFLLQHDAGELCLFGSSSTTSGGTLLARANANEQWKNHELPPLEFQLMRAVCARAIDEASLPSAVRGCCATKQLAKDLPFQTRYANEENVRQVVRRLRAALAECGADGVLAVAPGRGYYLTCKVSVPGG